MKKSTSSNSRTHLGGTLMGFVVGLLVGLAAALAVAVYVTRVPVPFVDRGLSSSPEQDAQEAERNRGWNPNNAITGTPSGAAAPGVPTPDSAGAIAVPPTDSRVQPPPGGAAGTDPIGDLLNRRAAEGGAPTAPTAAAAPGADPFTYFVQAGAYRNGDDAEAQRARLAMLGITATVDEREQSGRTIHRVRVGPFAQKALADLTIEQLQVNGIEAALVRVQR